MQGELIHILVIGTAHHLLGKYCNEAANFAGVVQAT
jgi:hypothetical protein